jgi:putative oxidoreductase
MASISNRQSLIVPSLGATYAWLDEFAYPGLRLIMGLTFVPHGCQKILGWFGGRTMEQYVELFGRMGSWSAHAGWVYYIGLLELVGGLMLAVGFLTRLVALQFFAFMVIAAFIANWPRGFFWTQGGIETPLVWAAVCFFLLIYGGGKHSVDRALGREF